MLPATFGMIVLAYPLYTLFYRPDTLGASVLVAACISGLILGLFMLTSSMLQGMYHNTEAVIFFFYWFVAKIYFAVSGHLAVPSLWSFSLYNIGTWCDLLAEY